MILQLAVLYVTVICAAILLVALYHGDTAPAFGGGFGVLVGLWFLDMIGDPE